MIVTYGERTKMLGLKRGLHRRCPNCGEGRLFRGYLAVEPHCPVCGHDNGAYRADDGPAYFTVLLVGHLIVAPMLIFPFIRTWPVLTSLSVMLPPIVLATLVLLPLAKGALIGFQWGAGGNTDR